MNREVVIIKSLLIDQPKQVKVFDIKIPRQAKNIIGVEMGMQWLLGERPTHPAYNSRDGFMKIYPNVLIGELKLQSYERATIFYAQELKLHQNFIHTDFSSSKFSPQPFTHQTHSHEDPITIDGNITIAQGIYKDQLALTTPYKYIVTIYIWIENKES